MFDTGVYSAGALVSFLPMAFCMDLDGSSMSKPQNEA